MARTSKPKQTTRTEQKADFVRRVVTAATEREGATITKEAATKLAVSLWLMGPKSSRLAEAACNRELTKREDRIDTEMDERVVAIGKALGLNAYRQGDPRGWTIRVEVPKHLADCWDGLTTGCG